MHLRIALLQPAQHVAVPIERELGMQTAHYVKFRDALGVTASGALPDFFERKGVSGGVLGLLAECAQFATRHAHVGRIDVAVDVEKSLVAMKALAHLVRHPTNAEEIRSSIKDQPVVPIQALTSLDFVADEEQAWIVK